MKSEFGYDLPPEGVVVYRPHRGGLAQAMRERQEVRDLAHLCEIIQSDPSSVTVEEYGNYGHGSADKRIGWPATYIVCANGHVEGFTSGPLE